jgi:peptide/nickel transport system substrate-binding protein
VLSLGHVAALYGADGPLAYAGYAAPDLRQAFERVRRATGEAALADAWRDVQVAIARGEPTAWLYHARGVQGVSRRIEGLRMDLRGELAGIAGWRVGAGAGGGP